ncbi:MAG: hypothetical protein ACRCTA_03815, partial [Bacilli bacterium]
YKQLEGLLVNQEQLNTQLIFVESKGIMIMHLHNVIEEINILVVGYNEMITYTMSFLKQLSISFKQVEDLYTQKIEAM